MTKDKSDEGVSTVSEPATFESLAPKELIELPTAPRIIPGSGCTVLRGHDANSTWAVVAFDLNAPKT